MARKRVVAYVRVSSSSKAQMDTFKEHVHSGEKMDATDTVVLRQLTDRIVVCEDRLEIHLRIGVVLEQKYL